MPRDNATQFNPTPLGKTLPSLPNSAYTKQAHPLPNVRSPALANSLPASAIQRDKLAPQTRAPQTQTPPRPLTAAQESSPCSPPAEQFPGSNYKTSHFPSSAAPPL